MFIINNREGVDFEDRIENLVFEKTDMNMIMIQLDGIHDLCDPMLLKLYEIGYVGQVLNEREKFYREYSARSVMNSPFNVPGCGMNVWAMFCSQHPTNTLDKSIVDIRGELWDLLGEDYAGNKSIVRHVQDWVREGKLVPVKKNDNKKELEKQIKKLQKRLERLEKNACS